MLMILFKTRPYLELEHMRVWSRSALGLSWLTQAPDAPRIKHCFSPEAIIPSSGYIDPFEHLSQTAEVLVQNFITLGFLSLQPTTAQLRFTTQSSSIESFARSETREQKSRDLPIWVAEEHQSSAPCETGHCRPLLPWKALARHHLPLNVSKCWAQCVCVFSHQQKQLVVNPISPLWVVTPESSASAQHTDPTPVGRGGTPPRVPVCTDSQLPCRKSRQNKARP